ncbi:copper chaperone PCu(A)C [Steroidobacter sp.]|uniref:copper chaperone PCu(A)C n=1 Tax=Steroidobacter sp. TaxID=1978227 RepID=UPI001A5FA6A0|nr:copper chaperone PCu(A)C [Steroidobacter sp.]MBL8265053.1 copper chaperone PCu(A)C [Steroidobacter sp.]
MTRVLRKALITAMALLAAGCGQSQREPVTVNDAWANATPVGATVAGVYLEISVGQPDTLLAASTTVADHIEMHTSSEENGMMKMRPLPTVQLVPARPFTFAPGGAHFMLMDLRQPLAAGMKFPMTLEFEKAGERTVQVEVVEPGSR